jgi:hypothetical protein
MTRTQRRRDTAYPTRDGKHNPICIDPDCKIVDKYDLILFHI